MNRPSYLMLRLYGRLVKSTRSSNGSRSGKYWWKVGASSDKAANTRPVGVTWLGNGLSYSRVNGLCISSHWRDTNCLCTDHAYLVRSRKARISWASIGKDRLLGNLILDSLPDILKSRHRPKEVPGLWPSDSCARSVWSRVHTFRKTALLSNWYSGRLRYHEAGRVRASSDIVRYQTLVLSDRRIWYLEHGGTAVYEGWGTRCMMQIWSLWIIRLQLDRHIITWRGYVFPRRAWLLLGNFFNVARQMIRGALICNLDCLFQEQSVWPTCRQLRIY